MFSEHNKIPLIPEKKTYSHYLCLYNIINQYHTNYFTTNQSFKFSFQWLSWREVIDSECSLALRRSSATLEVLWSDGMIEALWSVWIIELLWSGWMIEVEQSGFFVQHPQNGKHAKGNKTLYFKRDLKNKISIRVVRTVN